MSDALFDKWDQAIENFAAFVSTVDDWGIASPCPGWSVSDLVAHIIDFESQLAGDPQPEHTPDWSSLSHVSSDFGRFTEITTFGGANLTRVCWKNSLTVTPALSNDLAHFPPMPPFPGFASHPSPRLLGMHTFDVWVHEQDIRMAVEQPGNMTNRERVRH